MTGRTRRCWAAAGLGVAALVVVGAGAPASVANVSRSAPDRAGVKDSGFAGYQVVVPGKRIRTATETFVIPAITCRKNYSGVGPSVVLASTVNKRTNTYSSDGAGIGVACVHKQPVYQSIIEVDSKFTNDVPLLSAGDHVDVTATMGKHKVTVTLEDLTTGTTFTHSGKGAIGASVYLGCRTVELKKHSLGLDPFGKIKITDAEVNGKSLKAEKAVKATWVHRKSVLVSVGKLSKGKDFTLSFKHSR